MLLICKKEEEFLPLFASCLAASYTNSQKNVCNALWSGAAPLRLKNQKSVLLMNSLYRAGSRTCAAIDAFAGIDLKL